MNGQCDKLMTVSVTSLSPTVNICVQHGGLEVLRSAGMPPRTFACIVSSDVFGFLFYFFLIFFVSGPCAGLSWPSRQLLSAR